LKNICVHSLGCTDSGIKTATYSKRTINQCQVTASLDAIAYANLTSCLL